MSVWWVIKAHWPCSPPTFSYSWRNSNALGVLSQRSCKHLFMRPQFLFFPFPNEEGNEMAFQESMEENPLVLSSGNSWALIVIREHSPDFQATGWFTCLSTTLTLQCSSIAALVGSGAFEIWECPVGTFPHTGASSGHPRPISSCSLISKHMVRQYQPGAEMPSNQILAWLRQVSTLPAHTAKCLGSRGDSAVCLAHRTSTYTFLAIAMESLNIRY